MADLNDTIANIVAARNRQRKAEEEAEARKTADAELRQRAIASLTADWEKTRTALEDRLDTLNVHLADGDVEMEVVPTGRKEDNVLFIDQIVFSDNTKGVNRHVAATITVTEDGDVFVSYRDAKIGKDYPSNMNFNVGKMGSLEFDQVIKRLLDIASD